MKFSATIFSISEQALFGALKRSNCLGRARDGDGKYGIVPNTCTDGTNHFDTIWR